MTISDERFAAVLTMTLWISGVIIFVLVYENIAILCTAFIYPYITDYILKLYLLCYSFISQD